MISLKSILSPSSGWWSQLVRYAFSGGVAFLVDFGLLWVLTDWIGCYYQVGVACGYLAGLAITYTFSTFWIFNEHRTQNRLLEIVGFSIIGLLGMAVTHLTMWILTDLWLGERLYLLAKLITTVLVTFLNFILKKYILFTQSHAENV